MIKVAGGSINEYLPEIIRITNACVLDAINHEKTGNFDKFRKLPGSKNYYDFVETQEDYMAVIVSTSATIFLNFFTR